MLKNFIQTIMKISRLFAAAILFALLSIQNIQAQPKSQPDWHAKMMSEKIAYITSALELTPQEAQVFWPVYNQVAKEKHEAQVQIIKAYHALSKALKEDNASEKEIDKLLDNYLTAKQASKDADKGEVEKFRKVLSGEKVARLYIAEEGFRRHYIHHMKGNNKEYGRPADRN